MPALGKLIVKVGADIAEYMSKMGMLQSKMLTTGKRLQGIGKNMSSMGRKLTRNVTLPIIGIGVAAFKMSADFEASMTKIETLVGESQKQVGKWGKDILEMAPKLGRSPRELAEGLFFVTSAGFKGAEAMDILEVSAKAAVIGLGETKDIANAVTSVLTAYGKENITAARATEILRSTVEKGKMEASELAAVIGRVLPMASQLGISFEEVGANIATFTRLGISSSEAVVGLRGVMSALIKPTKESEEALKKMEMTSEDLRKKVGKDGLAKTLMFLLEATDGNVEALGAIVPNVRALTNVLATAGSQGEEYGKILEFITDTHGKVDEGFERTRETAKSAWDRIKAAVEVALIHIGAALAPFVADLFGKLMPALKRASEWFSKLDKPMKTAILAFALVLAAIGPVIFIIGGFVGAIGTILTAIGAIVGAVGIPVLVAALIGLGITFGIVGDNAVNDWEGTKKKLLEIWEAVKVKFQEIVDDAKAMFTKWKRAIKAFVDSEAWKNLKSAISDLGDSIASLVPKSEKSGDAIAGMPKKSKKKDWEELLSTLRKVARAITAIVNVADAAVRAINQIAEAWDFIKGQAEPPTPTLPKKFGTLPKIETRQHGGEIPGSSGQAVPILAHAKEIMFPENVSSFLKRVGIPIVSSQAGQAGTMKIEVGVNDSKLAEVIKVWVNGELIKITGQAELIALAGG